MKSTCARSIFSLCCAAGLFAQPSAPVAPPGLPGAARHLYKTTGTRPLYLYVLSPAKAALPRPAIVFFFGGGWVSGTASQFAEQAKHFTERGIVSVLVDYRVKSRDQSTVFDSVRDARSALRWVRGHAAELHVDPAKIVASGGSAGGHLAGATALLTEIDDPTDDLRISPAPAALVLFNPVMDTTETGFGAKAIGKDAEQLSLTHHITGSLPPTILFHGTADRTVPFANAEHFAKRARAAGADCRLVPFEGADHGFFNSPAFRKTSSPEIYERILAEVDRFLAELGLEASTARIR